MFLGLDTYSLDYAFASCSDDDDFGLATVFSPNLDHEFYVIAWS